MRAITLLAIVNPKTRLIHDEVVKLHDTYTDEQLEEMFEKVMNKAKPNREDLILGTALFIGRDIITQEETERIIQVTRNLSNPEL